MKLKTIILTVLSSITLAACSDWTATESITVGTTFPWESDSDLWETYKAGIRDYKSHEHNIVYARFENSPENPVSEKNSLRSLPDSLDIVSLTNAENFSPFDAEDISWLHSLGTKVLYRLDFAGKLSLTDEAAMSASLDKAIAAVREYGLDGWSFTGTPKAGDATVEAAAHKIVATLAGAKTGGHMLVFEGVHSFVAKEDISEIDLFVLATEDIERSYDLKNAVADAKDYGIEDSKILIAARLDGVYYDEDNRAVPVMQAMADNVGRFGPMAGLAIYNMESDYFHTEGNWLTIRQTISRLNP